MIRGKSELAPNLITTRAIKRTYIFLFAILISASPLLSHAKGSAEALKIAQIKAAYLYNILKFTHWPEEVLNDSKLTICLIGENRVAQLLTEGLNGRTAQQKELLLTHLTNNETNLSKKLSSCHFIYLATDDRQFNKRIISYVKGKNILVSSDSSQFSKDGGMIELKIDPKKGKVLIYVNMNSIEASRISISSKLLKLATIIRE